MMKTKHVQQILPPPPSHMVGDGFRVHNFFPHGYDIQPHRMSPFYLLDYNAKIDFCPRETPRGVGVHPHRGFKTVTIVYSGKVAHHDSRGNRGVVGPGDIQWMTAGAGVLHKEYHEAEYSRKGGPFHVVQLWVNLPASYKMSEPGYQPITNEMIPKYILPEEGGTADVIAGTFKGVQGIARTFTPIEMYNLRLKGKTALAFTLPRDYNTGILVVEGNLRVNGNEMAPADNFILFRNDGEKITLETEESTTALVLSGQPIKEPIVAYGPFLMNTKEEIMDAFHDLNSGKFGKLEDE